MEKAYNDIKRLTDYFFYKHRQTGMAIALLDSGHPTRYILNGCAAPHASVKHSTAFQVASLSKPVAAWGIMKLVDLGVIELDVDINFYLKRWKLPVSLSNPVTARRLLSHTAGLHSRWYYGKTEKNYHGNTILQSVQDGTKWQKCTSTSFQYSGVGYSILQMLIEDVTDMDFESYMQKYILEPLGMFRSTFVNLQKLKPDIARGHVLGQRPLLLRLYTEMAAAGLYSTIEDYSTFLYVNLQAENQAVLRETTIKQMHQRVSREIPYGLGFAIKSQKGIRISYHDGLNLGWRSNFILVPSMGKGILTMTNSLFFSRRLIRSVNDLWLSSIFSLKSKPCWLN